MASVTEQQVKDAISTHIDPFLKKDFVSAKSIQSVTIDGGQVNIAMTLGFPSKTHNIAIETALSKVVTAIEGVEAVAVTVTNKITAHAAQKGVDLIKGVKNIIAVASGKGGVGKSTTAVNLALALSAEGANVGMLDADIYGPSQPRMLGASGQPESPDGKTLEPMMSHNIKSMSIGYLIDEETPMIWRGPMVTQALEQLLNDTNWGDLDYLIVDLPPGTGDTQLTLAQKIPVSGAVIITTPQDISLLDARKGLKMFSKVQVPVLGVIENMSIHICSNCGHEEHIFGEGGGIRMAGEEDVEFLGSLPLDKAIREDADNGKPTVVNSPDSRISSIYRDMALRVTAKLASQAKDYSNRFPNIKIISD